jgi:hypothetical protein
MSALQANIVLLLNAHQLQISFVGILTYSKQKKFLSIIFHDVIIIIIII